MAEELLLDKKKEKNKSPIKRLVNILEYLLIIVITSVICVSGILFYQVVKNPGNVPSIGGYKPLTVLTGSMIPMLKPGDMVIVKDVQPSDVKPGDVITFKAENNMLVTHRATRIINKDGKLTFVTKGDANNSEDIMQVESKQLVGKLAFNIPYAGSISKFAKSKKGFLLFIVFPIMILIIRELKSILTEVRKGRKKKSRTESDMVI